jgi:DNA-binding SARP family transcriptional activator
MIELRILGVLDLRTADGRPLDEALTRSKRIALLAYLATARPLGFHRRDKLVTLFWPDLDKERARGALRTTLSRLRDDLGDDVIESRGVEEIAIRRDRVWCDAAALREHIGQGDVLEAAALYGGAMLDGVHVSGTSEEFEQWLSAERDAIRRTLLGAVSAEAEMHAARGELAEAADYARRARDLAPEDEVAARRLIRIMLSAGDRGAALLAYDMIESVLRRDFGVQPSDETRALVSALRDETPPAPQETSNNPRQTRASAYSLGTDKRRIVLNGIWIAAATIVVSGAALAVRRLPLANTAVTVSPWRPLTQMQGQFRGRVGVSAFMDTAGGIVVFGGALPGDPGQRLDIRDEMWRLSSVRDESRGGFVRVHPAGERLGPRWLAAVTYDDVHDRAILHGGALGSTSPCTNDTWVLDNGSGRAGAPTWRRVTIRGDAPPTHAGVEARFDAAARRLVTFGGNDCFTKYFNDVWILDFDDADLTSGHWTKIDADGVSGLPAPRNTAAVWLDANVDRLFVFGGTAGTNPTNDLWVLEGLRDSARHATWRPLRCAGETPTRTLHTAVYDGRTNSALIFGGVDASSTYRRELFRLTGLGGRSEGCRWEQIPFAEPWPQARSRPQMIFDRRSQQLVLFGGEYQNTSFADVWTIERPFGR